MDKEELEQKLKELVAQAMAANDQADNIFNEARDLGLQGAAVNKALADLKTGKSAAEVLDELEQTIDKMYAKDTAALNQEIELEKSTEEGILKKIASDEADQ